MKLRGCPFCSSGNVQLRIGPKTYVLCLNCEARGPLVRSDDYTRDEYVIGRWNDRRCDSLLSEESAGT